MRMLRNFVLGIVHPEASAPIGMVDNVFHIFSATSLRAHSADFPGAQMIATHAQDQLLYIDLPLFAGEPPARVLTLVVSQGEQSCTVLLDDDGPEPVVKQLLGAAIPAIYNPHASGSMRELFARHPDASAAIFEAGDLVASSLTSVRALTFMLSEPALSANEALSRAREIGDACAKMHARQAGFVARLMSGAMA